MDAALESSSASSSAAETEEEVDINISTRCGKQKSCCCHSDVIIRRATAASEEFDADRCLQVAKTGPTASCRNTQQVNSGRFLSVNHLCNLFNTLQTKRNIQYAGTRE